ncbi:MAG: hypothetical protein UY92_C0013G0023 [Candidatus Magasanikbacteria bacterium GW2011_GWA2_56_11]|uniref:Uncharacterized protein n=1 Tax=Candidatus Magasanikbacteria bacterium GW2011_GWA2_56_11 TaxID=1619044 RepID=A0A0G2B8P3_9BACT|nr:MAG: hypothetical protein UY92_C0013G0023 [Candidatus Magasanikbacteria bacterium GW2011_GWA2_56_11]
MSKSEVRLSAAYRVMIKIICNVEGRSILSTIDPELAEIFSKDFDSNEELAQEVCVFLARDKGKFFNKDFRHIVDLTRIYIDETRDDLEPEFAEKLSPLVVEVKNKFKAAADKYKIPFTHEDIDRVFEETSVHLDDGVLVALDEGVQADYNAKEGLVRISADAPPEKWGAYLAHEFVHALAGRSVVLTTRRAVPWLTLDSILKEEFMHVRGGLKFVGPSASDELNHGPRSKNIRFRWLDEAMTESFARFIRQDYGFSDVYLHERYLLLLLSKSLGNSGKGLFYFENAYFEHYNPHGRPEDRLKYWKILNSKLTEKFGPRFLVNLDKFVQLKATRDNPEAGILSAIEKLETDPEGIAEYLRTEIKNSRTQSAKMSEKLDEVGATA